MNYRQTYFPGLDGLRAVSVFLVILHHIGMIFSWWPFQGGPAWISSIFFQMMRLGFVGVDIFFVISGFLIAGLLLEDITGSLRLKRFYVRRIFKILPQYLVVVVVGFFLSIVVYEQYHRPQTYLGYLFFLQNYGDQIEILRHLWTIAVEEHFYIFLPLIFWCVWSVTKKSTERFLWLLLVFLGLICSVNGLRWYESIHSGLSSINQPPTWQFTHRRFDALVFGCFLRLVLPFLIQWKQKLPFMPLAFLISGGLVCIGLINQDHLTAWFDYLFLYASCGLILLSIVLGSGLLNKFLEIPVLSFIGRNSYGIYIWHMASIFFFRDLFVHYHSLWFVLLYFLTTLFLGILSTMTIEKRFLNLRRRLMP